MGFTHFPRSHLLNQYLRKFLIRDGTCCRSQGTDILTDGGLRQKSSVEPVSQEVSDSRWDLLWKAGDWYPHRWGTKYDMAQRTETWGRASPGPERNPPSLHLHFRLHFCCPVLLCYSQEPAVMVLWGETVTLLCMEHNRKGIRSAKKGYI